MIPLRIRVEDYASRGFDRLEQQMPQIMDEILQEQSLGLKRIIQNEYLSGQSLGVRTGKTRGSIGYKKPSREQGRRSGKGTVLVYMVYPRGHNYIGIFETGGWIRPKKARILRFFSESGEPVFAHQVRIRRRPWRRPAVAAMEARGIKERAADRVISRRLKELWGLA